MIKQILNGLADLTEKEEQAARDVLMLQFTVVNAFILTSNNRWVLIDTGLESSYDFIAETAERFGGKPDYILLTHGHFDHVGSVRRLAELWDAAVYAHELEFPYLTGEQAYPKGQPDADEGLIAKMSAHFPEQPIDIGSRLMPLPQDGIVPNFTEWRWIATPGHTPGHVSLYRESDGVLIAGDAITGTKQESLWGVLTQKEAVKGPPAYFTQDWDASEASVKRLRDLNPSLALFSHGKPLAGGDLAESLWCLSDRFDDAARPHNK